MPVYRFGDMVIDPARYPWGCLQSGQSLQFDGGVRVIVPDHPSLRIGTQDFKVSAKINISPAIGDSNTIISKGHTGATEFVFFLVQGRLRFYASGGAIDAWADDVATKSSWLDVFFERSGSTGTLSVNGSTVKTVSGIGSADISTTLDISIGASEVGASRRWIGGISVIDIEIGGSVISKYFFPGSGLLLPDLIGRHDGKIYPQIWGEI